MEASAWVFFLLGLGFAMPGIALPKRFREQEWLGWACIGLFVACEVTALAIWARDGITLERVAAFLLTCLAGLSVWQGISCRRLVARQRESHEQERLSLERQRADSELQASNELQREEERQRWLHNGLLNAAALIALYNDSRDESASPGRLKRIHGLARLFLDEYATDEEKRIEGELVQSVAVLLTLATDAELGRPVDLERLERAVRTVARVRNWGLEQLVLVQPPPSALTMKEADLAEARARGERQTKVKEAYQSVWNKIEDLLSIGSRIVETPGYQQEAWEAMRQGVIELNELLFSLPDCDHAAWRNLSQELWHLYKCGESVDTYALQNVLAIAESEVRRNRQDLRLGS